MISDLLTLRKELISAADNQDAADRKARFDAQVRREIARLFDDPQYPQRRRSFGVIRKRLGVFDENDPELKAIDNFLGLQKELADTEDMIEMARRFYNGAVRELNTAVESFPSNLLAGAFGFSQRTYFEIEPADRPVPSLGLDAGP